MWCAYAFAVVALFGLPGAIHGGVSAVVQWIAQTFLQLALLSITLVGQNVQAAASDKRALDTYIDTQTILREVPDIMPICRRRTTHCDSTWPCWAACATGSPGKALVCRRIRNSSPHHDAIDYPYEAYAKVSLKKYRPMAARNEDKKVFSGLL